MKKFLKKYVNLRLVSVLFSFGLMVFSSLVGRKVGFLYDPIAWDEGTCAACVCVFLFFVSISWVFRSLDAYTCNFPTDPEV